MNLDDEDENAEKRDHYEVGKNKPPKEHQFKKGDDWRGNRGGRPKDSLNFETMMTAALNAKVEIPLGGKRVKRTMGQLTILTTVQDAAKGKHQARKTVFEHMQKVGAKETEQAKALSQNHQLIIEQALERRAKKQKKYE